MSITTDRSSATTQKESAQTHSADAHFEQRWALWKARGLALDGASHRAAIVTIAVLLAAVIAYGWFVS